MGPNHSMSIYAHVLADFTVKKKRCSLNFIDLLRFLLTIKNMTEEFENSAESISGVSVLRPELRHEQIELRGRGLSVSDRGKILRALRAFHTLEIMAVTIYRYQITRDQSEHNRELIAAMCNEMTHVQDFQTKLYEYGMCPSLFRWAYWIVGFVFGFVSRLLGAKAILMTGIWVESKAVAHYAELLEAAPWDEPTRRVIEKDRSDENGHIRIWRQMLSTLDT